MARRSTSFIAEPTEKISRPIELIEAEGYSTIWMRVIAIKYLLIVYSGMLICTFTIYFLQGFKWRGFDLSYSLLNWLGAATIGEVGGLLALVYGALFRRE
ncbi:hypothetical protein ES702_07489 [subsurface metagenome]